MGVRLLRRVRWISNGVLVAVGCLLTAYTAANVMAAAAPRSPSPETLRVRSSSPAAPEPAQPRQPETLERSRLPVALIGTFAASEPSLSHATLYDSGRKETFVVGVGDLIENQAVVVHVERGRIVLREDGVPRELTLEADQAASTLSSGAPTVEASLSDVERTILDAMAGQARVLPKVEDGHLVGLHVSAIQKGSRFEEMGIEGGDVITQFNGISIGSSAEALRAAKEMLGAEADGFYVLTRRDDDVVYLHGRWQGRGQLTSALVQTVPGPD